MTSKITQQNKAFVWEFWQKLNETKTEEYTSIMQDYLSDDITWIGPHPINQLNGIETIYTGFWESFLASFPDIQRENFIFFGGKSNGRIDGNIDKDGHEWVCGLGNFVGTFQNDWLSIPANGKEVKIRWSEFCRLEEGKIIEIHILLDIPDLMRQAGFPVLPPDRGAIGLWSPPKAKDGILLDKQDESETLHSLDLIRAMIYDGLNSFDEAQLKSMDMAQFFHPELHWYGPSGIGGCRNLKEFEDFHQKHWLHAFPDRQVQDLDSLFTEGRYMGASGWAGVIATHTGQYLDVPVTGKAVRFYGIDIWIREGNQLTENWVFVDMIDLYRQFGIDLFERLQKLIEQEKS